MHCKAWSRRNQQQCRNHAMRGQEVCRMHGGKTPRGPASVHYKDGRHSRFLPARMFADYTAAGLDPELMSLRRDLALLDARIIDVLKRVDQGEVPPLGPADDAIWRRVAKLIDQRRKLVEAEQRRLTLAQEMLSQEQAMVLMGQVVDILRRHIPDRDILSRIAQDMQAVGYRSNGHAADPD
jgi:hypothetical protein